MGKSAAGDSRGHNSRDKAISRLDAHGRCTMNRADLHA